MWFLYQYNFIFLQECVHINLIETIHCKLRTVGGDQVHSVRSRANLLLPKVTHLVLAVSLKLPSSVSIAART